MEKDKELDDLASLYRQSLQSADDSAKNASKAATTFDDTVKHLLNTALRPALDEVADSLAREGAKPDVITNLSFTKHGGVTHWNFKLAENSASLIVLQWIRPGLPADKYGQMFKVSVGFVVDERKKLIALFASGLKVGRDPLQIIKEYDLGAIEKAGIRSDVVGAIRSIMTTPTT